MGRPAGQLPIHHLAGYGGPRDVGGEADGRRGRVHQTCHGIALRDNGVHGMGRGGNQRGGGGGHGWRCSRVLISTRILESRCFSTLKTHFSSTSHTRRRSQHGTAAHGGPAQTEPTRRNPGAVHNRSFKSHHIIITLLLCFFSKNIKSIRNTAPSSSALCSIGIAPPRMP